MCEKLLFVASLIAFVHVTNAGLASFINKCTAEDSECIKQSTDVAIPIFAAGIPELGVETLDPIHFKSIDAGSKDLQLILSDITIAGLKDCKTIKVTRDSAESKIDLEVLCSVVVSGHYNVSGKILVIPMEGNGPITIYLNKIAMRVKADYEEKVKGGKMHWSVKGWKHTYKLKDVSKIELENLFEGNEVLGKTAKEVLDNSANDVILEVCPPIIQTLITRLIKAIKHFLDKIPADELALN